VSNRAVDTLSCSTLEIRGSSCVLNSQFSSVTIQPGATYTEHIFLNAHNDFKSAGDYTVDAKHFDGLGYRSNLAVETKLHLRIDPHTPLVDSDVFQTWVEQLRSPQRRERIEAARVLAYLGPPDFEDVLFGFVDNPEFRRFAPLAFQNLNTPRSIAALATLAEGPPTNQQSESVIYLAETNDPKWIPLLFRAAQEHAVISSFPSAAARLGGEKAIPMLVSLEKNSDQQFARINAVTALGDTGSRAAVPMLLEYLKSPETDISERARYGLETLTHRTARVGSSKQPPQTEYVMWSQWWERSSKTAPIYSGAQFCTKRVPLPQNQLANQNKNKVGSGR